VWTGSEMIVWGGEIGNSPFNTGGRYNPAADSWTANTTTTGAPAARYGHSAVWTGSEMIVWGGRDVGNTGGRYTIASSPTISPTTQSFTAAGGAGSVNVTAPGGCAWTATSDANWLSITSGGSGAGNSAVAFSVAANTLGPRTGILTFGGQRFIVRQAGIATSRVIRVVATRAAPGNISAPIEIVSQGDENAMGFTLTFDPAALGNPQVALGADAAGARLSTNTSEAAQGRLGIVLALAAGQMFAAGTRQFAVVTFTTQANASLGVTQLDFDDLPAAREVSDAKANALPASYQGGSISIVTGFEADIAPRPEGNGSVTVTDYVQIGRFVAGLDTAAAGFEFQRADCAPRASLGDGLLTVADWVQVGRYATGADPATAAGGPTAQASQLSLVNVDVSPDSSRAIGHRAQVRHQPAVIHGRQLAQTGGERQERLMNFVVELDAHGNENALGLSMRFDPAQWRFAGATAGRDTRNATLHVNALQSANGYVGLAMALPTGEILPVGAREIVVIRFIPLSRRSALTRAVEFADYPVRRELVDSRANVAPADFVVEQRK
jgi:hypothetical protein